MPVEEPTTVDVDEAAAFLRRLYRTEIGDVEVVGEGLWSRCFGFTLDGRELVVRFGRHRIDFDKDRVAARYAAPGLPVPEVLDVGAYGDGFYAVSARAHGEPLEVAESPEEFRRRLPSLLVALDALRTADISHTSGFGGWDEAGRAGRARWRDVLVSVDASRGGDADWRQLLRDSPIPVGDVTAREAHHQLLDAADRCPEVRHLVHADLINRNVLAAGDGTITAVFDWGCSVYGDFLYDVAWLEIWTPWHAAMATVDIRSAVRDHLDDQGVDVPGFDDRVRACALHIGLNGLAFSAATEDWTTVAMIVPAVRNYLR